MIYSTSESLELSSLSTGGSGVTRSGASEEVDELGKSSGGSVVRDVTLEVEVEVMECLKSHEFLSALMHTYPSKSLRLVCIPLKCGKNTCSLSWLVPIRKFRSSA